MQDKQKGLKAIQALMAQYQITLSDLQSFQNQEQSAEKGATLVRLFAYLGGVFVLGGISVYVSMNWAQMTSILRVLVTLGSGFVAFVMALLILFESRYEKLVTPLFIVAALLELGGLLVLLDEYFTPTGHWEPASMFIHAVVGIQFGLSFIALKRDTLLFVAIYCAWMLISSWLHHLGLEEEINLILVGTGILATALYLRTTRYIPMTPIMYFIGSLLLLWGVFETTEGSWLELFYMATNLGLVYLSIVCVSRTLLFVSLVAMFGYISYFTYEYFVDSVGVPIVLIALGLLLFGLSGLGVKLNQKYLKG